jgi:two-component system cell cycle response regulator
MLARIGGEEFAALLPQATMAQAELVAEKFRDVTAQIPVIVNPGNGLPTTLHVTVSIGVASTDRIIDDDSISQLMSLADDALYEAKNSGRNRVVAKRG